METYYLLAFGSSQVIRLGEFLSTQDANDAVELCEEYGFDDLVFSETELIEMHTSIVNVVGIEDPEEPDVSGEETGDDLKELPKMEAPYTEIVTVQFVTTKKYLKKLCDFFYSAKWKYIIAKAIGATHLIHFSTDANNVKLGGRGLFWEEKYLCDTAFGEGTAERRPIKVGQPGNVIPYGQYELGMAGGHIPDYKYTYVKPKSDGAVSVAPAPPKE